MLDPARRSWRELCLQAAAEEDPKKLLELAAEIDKTLEDDLKKTRPSREQKTGTARRKIA